MYVQHVHPLHDLVSHSVRTKTITLYKIVVTNQFIYHQQCRALPIYTIFRSILCIHAIFLKLRIISSTFDFQLSPKINRLQTLALCFTLLFCFSLLCFGSPEAFNSPGAVSALKVWPRRMHRFESNVALILTLTVVVGVIELVVLI